MKLYFKAGACSLAPHIVLAEMNTVYTLEAVDLANKTCATGDYWTINPKGSVPALKMENGEILTEGAIISQYLADQKPETNLIPKFGTADRYRCMEWMNFIATEVHKNMGTLFAVNGMIKNAEGNAEFRAAVDMTLSKKMDFISKKLDNKNFLMGDNFTIADAYLFTCLGWSKFVNFDLTKWPTITNYMNRVFERPAVQKAMKEEGLL